MPNFRNLAYPDLPITQSENEKVMLKSYLKIAYRNLSHNKVFSTINILGLTVGMAASIIIFVWVQNELSYDSYHQRADQTYRIITHWNSDGNISNNGSVPLPLKEKALAEIPAIESFSLLRLPFASPVVEVRKGKLFKEKHLTHVEKEWFEQFDYIIKEGSVESFFDNIYSIGLTEKRAKKYFGDISPIGKIVSIDSIQYMVEMVLADNPSNSSFQYEAMIPMSALHADKKQLKNDQNWSNFNYMGFVTLAESADLTAVSQQLSSIFKGSGDKYYNNTTVSLTPLADIRFDNSLRWDKLAHQNRSTVYILALIGFLILFVAAINYINLSTALVNKRVKEIGIKKVVGASFKHIFYQVLLETLLVCGISFVLALVMTHTTLPILNTHLETSLTLEKVGLWQLLIGLLLVASLLAGIYPAILFGRFKPLRLIQKIQQPKEGLSLRKTLVIAQFFIALIVLMSTIVIQQQLRFIQNKEVGYDRTNVLKLSLEYFEFFEKDNAKKWNLLEEKLREIPELQAIAQTNGSLVEIVSSRGNSLTWEGQTPNTMAPVFSLYADEYLVDVFDLKLIEGRWYQKNLETDKNNIIINEKAAATYGLTLGQQVTFANKIGKIIGITKDFNYKSLHQPIEPLLISYNERGSNTILAKVQQGDIPKSLAKVEKTFTSIFPDIPFTYTFMDDSYLKLHESEVRMTWLFQLFASLLIFLSCLGLFGLATFAIERRSKEIGIRKVLGASTRIIVQLLSKDFLKLIVFALLLAIPIAYYALQQWLESYAYRIDIHWWYFAIAGLVVLFVAFLTLSFQSIRAALELSLIHI